MALIDISLPQSIAKALRLPARSPKRQQIRVLKKLLKKARFTEFGQAYRFDELLLSKHAGKKFQQHVPVYDYSKIYAQWWHKALEGKPDVCWPGKIKFFALSSGTSEAASKYIPITNELMRGNKIVMIKQLLSLRTYHDISVRSIGKGWLMLEVAPICRKDQLTMQVTSVGSPPKKFPSGSLHFISQGKRLPKPGIGI